MTNSAWQPIETCKPVAVENYILWNGVRRFVGWLSDDGWCDVDVADHMVAPEDPPPTHWHPWPDPPVTDGGEQAQ